MMHFLPPYTREQLIASRGRHLRNLPRTISNDAVLSQGIHLTIMTMLDPDNAQARQALDDWNTHVRAEIEAAIEAAEKEDKRS